MIRACSAAILLLVSTGPAWGGSPKKSTDGPLFEKDVRPILKAYCFRCHGEGDKLEGGLDLRLKRFMVKGGDSGEAIVPGKLDESYLYDRIENGEMPPENFTKVPPRKRAVIAKWIATGARTARPEPQTLGPGPLITEEERNFWSFRPIRRPPVPKVKQTARVRTPIDAFLLAKLESNHLTFSPDADRQTLIRRATFDLIGLPPTPQQVAEFVNDPLPNAYERLIDRLLDSPAYGERWGRHWLDVAGYADSEGYTNLDPIRPNAFRYRDYVIAAFNSNKPFDQFIQEQLAGDEMVPQPYRNLSPSDVEKLTATGFLRMAPDGTGSGGVNQKLARNQVIADTLKIVSTSLLGMTVGCAQCHSHLYDPIPQSDYYQLRAVFAPAYDWKHWRRPRQRLVSLYTAADRAKARQIEKQAAETFDRQRRELTRKFIDQTLEFVLAQLPKDKRASLRTAYKTPPAKRTAAQKKLLKAYPRVLKLSSGSLYLYDRELVVRARKIDRDRLARQKQAVEAAFNAELAKLPADVRAAVRAARNTSSRRRSKPQRALLRKYPQVLVTAGHLAKYNPTVAAELKTMRQAAIDLRASQKAPQLKALVAKATALRAKKPEEKFVRALTEIPGHVPQSFVFYRGDPDQPKQPVKPSGLSVVADVCGGSIPINDSSLKTTGRRLAYARMLTNGKHPLVGRVLVNRFWLLHFGRGIVETPADFGKLGTRPTHPLLLDWLAREFTDSGWNLKRLHKLIMMSTVYRQSSKRTPALNAADPENHLYGRMSIRRLEAETIRDSVLFASGKLKGQMFGKPVPVTRDETGQVVVGVPHVDTAGRPLGKIPLHGIQFRRSLYIQYRRSQPLGMLATFDAPAMAPNCTARTASTVAPQSLMLMNSAFMVEYAGYFAERVRKIAGRGDLRAQAAVAWKLAYGREATKPELDEAVTYLQSQTNYYASHRPQRVKTTPDQLALAGYCQALMSASEFLYVD